MRKDQSDVDVVRQIFIEKEYDTKIYPEPHRRIVKRYSEILNEGKRPIIVDAGANIGAATIWFGTKYPEAKIIAIEPDENNLDVLRLNCGLNDRIAIVAGGVGATGGFAMIQAATQGWATRVERSTSGAPIISMNEAFKMTEGGVAFIAKIDIEGFEGDFFSSNLEWLDTVFTVVIEPHDWLLPGTSRTFQRAMAKHNFDLFILGENLVYIRP
jgi:FkbM family methyltransferase